MTATETTPGPCARTRRDLSAPLTWPGLSPIDYELLRRFASRLATPPDELHTDIFLGCDPFPNRLPAYANETRMHHRLWSRRLDAAICYNNRWWLLEVKREANAHALGQALAYYFWWCRDCPQHQVAEVSVLCESCSDDIAQIYAACGITPLTCPP